jgi:hypothetical protein
VKLNYNIKNIVGKMESNITLRLSQEVYKINVQLYNISSDIRALALAQEDCCRNLPVAISEEVPNHIVGESYYRWDATSTYFPTLIFKFKEENVYKYARNSQVRVRLKMRNEDLTQSDINHLRKQCDKLGPITYTYGTVRSHYINLQKRFKTTLFSESKQEAEFVFEKLLGGRGETFNKKRRGSS